MKIEDWVSNWISKTSTQLWQTMQDNVTNDEKWYKARGAYDLLEKFRMEFLIQLNPHNREDIRKYKEKINAK